MANENGVELGVVFPQLEIGTDARVIRTFAQTVEQLGYDHLLAYDHVLGVDIERDDPRVANWLAIRHCHRDAFHEPLMLFSHLAAATYRLNFVTGILILPQRQLALVAKQVAELSILSDGRLRLGVGVGWNTFEYESLNEDFDTRGPRMEEQIMLLQRLLSEELIDFEGDFHRFSGVGLNPRPEAGPPPIWMGAKTPAGFRRLARHATGWIAPLSADAPELPRWLELLRSSLEAAGRNPDEIGIEGRIELYGRTDEQAAEELDTWRQLGATHVSVQTMVSPDRRSEPQPPEAHLDRVASFIAALER